MRSTLVERVLRALSVTLAYLSGAAVLGLAFAVCFDIVARRFFAFSIQGTDEKLMPDLSAAVDIQADAGEKNMSAKR